MFAAEATAVIQHLPSLADEGAAFFEATGAGDGVALDMDSMEAEDGAGDRVFLSENFVPVTVMHLLQGLLGEASGGRDFEVVMRRMCIQ